MLAKVARCFGYVGLILMIGCAAGVSPAPEEGGASTLSRALSRVELFSGLTGAEREALETAATLRRGRAGERIIQQGETMGRMFIILEGRADVRVNGERVALLSGQTLVGEIEFLDGLPASADVILEKETDLIALDHAALNRLMEARPRLGYVLMREIAKLSSQRLRRSNPD